VQGKFAGFIACAPERMREAKGTVHPPLPAKIQNAAQMRKISSLGRKKDSVVEL
jgi:hypothetical protein